MKKDDRSEFKKWLIESNITEEDLDFMWEYCLVFNHRTISILSKSGINWRDLNLFLIKQIPDIYNELVKSDIIKERGN